MGWKSFDREGGERERERDNIVEACAYVYLSLGVIAMVGWEFFFSFFSLFFRRRRRCRC